MGITYNPYSLIDKTILITGASSGIGMVTAIECSKLGAKCVITGRNADRLQNTFSQLEGDGHVQIITDLSTQEGIDELVNQSPSIDGLVNNAGISVVKPISFIKESDLQKVFQTNTFSPILIVKAFIKKKKINTGGSIVFTSSIAAMHSSFGNSIYGASKAAVQAYMHYCARELSQKEIRVNAVHPAMVETKLIHNGAVSEEQHQIDMQKYPLKRYGKPEEIAWGIIYFLSDASSWTTGTSMIIDGGILLT